MKELFIGNKMAKYPVVQGGMGVGVSLHGLAGAVSKAGGIGVISAADIGYKDENFMKNPLECNLKAIGREIKLAREIAGEDKIIGINVMVALNNYAEIVTECVKQKVDLIVSGAGIPKDLPMYVKGSDTKIAPIVSSLRCCQIIVKHWKMKYDYVPDMIVIEGPKAGGHLGFKNEELGGDKEPALEDITSEIVPYIRNLEKETGKKIPVICGGGIWDSKDIKRFLDLGADGVQMATRFVATKECDASDEFKNAYINAGEEDVKIIKSPVGMPGRAVYNSFIKKTEKEKCKIDKCYGCIKTCDVKNTPYCITRALINAVEGNMEDALVFCGSNVGKVKEIVTVEELMRELMGEGK